MFGRASAGLEASTVRKKQLRDLPFQCMDNGSLHIRQVLQTPASEQLNVFFANKGSMCLAFLSQ